jgi:hypothetical protein
MVDFSRLGRGLLRLRFADLRGLAAIGLFRLLARRR